HSAREWILATNLPPDNHVELGTCRVQKGWQVRWIVLKVGVHHHEQLTAALGESCRKGHRLAKIAPQPNPAYTCVLQVKALIGRPRVIRAAVINEQQLVRLGSPDRVTNTTAEFGKTR